MMTLLLEELIQGKLDLEKLEGLLWKSLLNVFRHMMVEILELFDEKLMRDRDKTRYKLKERNPRTIQTLVGEVSFERRYYRDQDEEQWVYLLDEALGLESGDSIGPGLVKLAVTWATKGPSYRDARDRLTDLYGAQVLSHETIRQALLRVGEACRRELENKIVKEEGEKAIKALFIEVDGFGARLQKNKRLKRQNQRREAKMAIIHEGWAPRSKGKSSDYRLVDPTYICTMHESDDFWEHVRGVVYTKYRNIDSIPVIINGDGAPWIREGAKSFANGMYQYDRFHIARELRNALRSNPEALGNAQKALAKNDIGTLAIVVTEARLSCDNIEQEEKLEALSELLMADQDYIVDYQVRLKKKGFPVPANWRGLGAAESNVNKFKNRTAKRGRAWSEEGLAAVLTTLSRLFEGNLQETLSRTLHEAEEWILDRVTSGVGHVVKKTERISVGVKAGSFPATRTGTKGYAELFRALQNVELV